ncbi:hypothetical protein [Nonomuraea sp. NPDC049480]|uniref:hypothetical protein n=1 Tax=Nonomuraea sp. NPDC049480 TaxID=3364353 RepID=UPI0037A4C71C
MTMTMIENWILVQGEPSILHTDVALYGEIQLRTDRRLDMTCSPRAKPMGQPLTICWRIGPSP